jgi:hypothetical protein
LSQFALYRDPVLLEPVKHRHLKMAKLTDHGMAAAMQASFLAVAEFTSAAREFVIVFMRDTIDGKLQAEPIALLGVAPGENLYVDGTRWDAHYVPAFIRRYPYWLTTVQGVEAPVVMIDQAWSGFSEAEGDPLYEDDGKPAPRLAEAIEFMEQFEIEVSRTLGFCARLTELGLLREMSASVTLADGRQIALDGLLTVDDAKLQALPDAQVLEMHRNGMLGLVHAHLLSLANMQALVERKGKRLQQGQQPAPQA